MYMSQALKTQIVSEIVDENGRISTTESQEESLDIDINIRQDDLQMFWTEDMQLLIRTSEMDEDMYIQPIPSKEGFKCEIVFMPEIELTETEPALPAEQPDVSPSANIEIRMD